MAASDLINLSGLIDDAKCFAPVREYRWPEGGAAPRVTAAPSSGTATTTRSPVANATGARRVQGASTT